MQSDLDDIGGAKELEMKMQKNNWKQQERWWIW